MKRSKIVDGVTSYFTPEEELAADAIALEAAKPPTQAKLDAELDELTDAIDKGRSVIRALAVEVFQLAKAADPKLTPAKFKASIRNTIAGLS